MTKKLLALIIPILGIIGISTLSSFDQNNYTPSPDNKVVKYKAEGRTEKQKGLLNLSAAFQNDYYTKNNNQGYFYVQIKGDVYNNRRYKRPPMNLSIVIDRSGSMGGAKINNAKKAAKHIVDQLQSNDYLSIITYDNNVRVLHPQARVSNKQQIKNKIDNIRVGGATNLMGGAMKGYEEVNEYYKSGNINRVLLLSDGLANEGITDPKRIKKIVQNKFREENIAISTFGIGNNYNEDLMTAMAENGSGNYYFISKPTEIVSIFKKELNGLMDVIAQNSNLNIEVPSYVSIEEVYGYSFTKNRKGINIKLNDIFSEETKGILVRYRIKYPDDYSTVTFQTNLYFNNTKSSRNEVINIKNKQYLTSKQDKYNTYFSEWVESQVVLNDVNIEMEKAMQEIDKGNYDEGKKIVLKAKKIIIEKAELVENNSELQRAEVANESYAEDLKDIEVRSVSERQYIQKANKSTNYQIRRKK